MSYGALSLAKDAIKSRVYKFVGIGNFFEYDLSFGELAVDAPLKQATLYAAAKTSSSLTLSKFLAMQIMMLILINFLLNVNRESY